MSLTTNVDVFKPPRRGYYWSYYIITSSQELESALAHPLAQTYPVVLMFWASWNEPCRVMMRPFRAMAVAKRRAAIFCQVDVDKFKVGQRYRGAVPSGGAADVPAAQARRGEGQGRRRQGRGPQQHHHGQHINDTVLLLAVGRAKKK
ncbi:uncharacterized protein [Aegilops tauschii subsp. strangulata]|uniref:uncharacterized protein isoform X1 n=1 Tax=Aegilops tauschii subsp. strangulata TaxID=200361 RepID=UPI003CC8B2C6